jgi:hypothetical protein
MKPVFSSVASVRKTLAHWQPPDPHRDALTLRFGLGETDARQRRIGEHDIGNLPIVGPAIAASHVGGDDSEVVDRYMGELGAARALANRPNPWSGRLKSLVDADEAPGIELDPGLVETDDETSGMNSGLGRIAPMADGLC